MSKKKVSAWENKTEEIKLLFPVRWGDDEVVKTLKFKTPTTAHIMNCGDEMKLAEIMEIAGELVDHEGGLTLLKMTHARDGLAIAGVIQSFLDDSPQTTD